MAESALFIGWGLPFQGREQQALRVFGEIMEYVGRLQQQGEIESAEPFLLEPHGGDLGGFLLVRGEADRLGQLRLSDEFRRLSQRAILVVDRFGVVGAFSGQELNQQLEEYGQNASELAG